MRMWRNEIPRGIHSVAKRLALWYKVEKMTELERALLDIAEVRDRLATTQRFKGYSGVAAALSGVFAIVAGVVQAVVVPAPHTAFGDRLYFAIWFVCAAAATLVNYGAIAHWFVSDESARDRWQTRTVGLSIFPAVVLGAALSFALLYTGGVGELPGVWYGCYAVGLLASRTLVPRGVQPIAIAFLVVGVALLFAPKAIALSPLVLPLGFGAGQILIGYFVFRDRNVNP
jgi:hypothetical protein